jgi:DNA-binding NarL/FixJ family response regulator
MRIAIVAADPLARAAIAAALSIVGAVEIVDQLESADATLWDAGAEPVGMADRLAHIGAAGAPIVALVPDEAAAADAVNGGADGVVQRTADGATLLAALDAVRHGLRVIDPAVARPIVPLRAAQSDGIDRLTSREIEVLDLMSDGLSNKQIAARLDISEHTAKFHVNSILAKLGATTRTEAVVIAARRGLLIL